MPSIWDMLFPGGGQAPQFGGQDPNAQLPVPFPGPQQAPYFAQPNGGPQANAARIQAGLDAARGNVAESLIPSSLLPPSAAMQADYDRRMSGYMRQPDFVGKMDLPNVHPGAADQMLQGAGDVAMMLGPSAGEGAGLKFAAGLLPMARRALGIGAADVAKGAARTAAEDVAGAAAQPGIRAYHGSPHDFDQFDLSKIGTGEGAQAYGHGLYFAEAEGTARSYRDALSSGAGGAGFRQTPVPIIEGKVFEPRNYEITQIANKYDDPAKLSNALQDYIKRNGDSPYAHSEDAQHIINAINEGKYHHGIPGHMYEVNIGAHPEQFLDYDKPISKQSEHVQSVVKKLGIDDMDRSGETFYESVLGGREDAAKRLQQAGIPGIRYLDQGSRTAGEGSRNYVVFDPKMIEIMRKYGIAGLLSSGAASQLPIPKQQAPVF